MSEGREKVKFKSFFPYHSLTYFCLRLCLPARSLPIAIRILGDMSSSRVRTDKTKGRFSHCMIKLWNSLLCDVGVATSIDSFRKDTEVERTSNDSYP